MKFKLTWRLHEEHRHDALKGFSQMSEQDDKNDWGDKIKMIGRWHDLAGCTGVAIFESDDPKAIANWALNWNKILDCTVIPVLGDKETREVGKNRDYGD
ncbi:hypothetical protein GCM10023115_44200 [Pontixanthobacter gangjinensis]|uniref:DUF3303 domain-containing protein n=1 Tax=Christiangramia aestuarii TaxID=1028746 RepID=A0A7M3SY07_9FLAO|nr:DUF3303 family protein [Christiangramia aestuarii]MUP41488.1 DUF3303 domain-containing protein [Christiangramia aestuarii]